MFMAADRQPKMRGMIMAGDEAGRRAALASCCRCSRSDFEGIFEAMPGWPVTIRLLDPPLHEFLPDRVELHAGDRARADRSRPGLGGLEREFDRVRALRDQPDARHARRAARASLDRRCTRCRSRAIVGPRSRCVSVPAAGRTSRS